MSEAVLVALGDLTNGALNYYQTPHVVMIKREIIDTYIEQLQQEKQQLKEVIEEVRGKLKEHLEATNYELETYEWFGREYLEELLQILDKVKEN